MKFSAILPDAIPSGRSTSELRIRRAFERIANHPEAAECVEQRPQVRRLPLVRYPYVIYYGAMRFAALHLFSRALRCFSLTSVVMPIR
jgi:hypothetical protein